MAPHIGRRISVNVLRRLITLNLETPSKRHLNIWKDISEKEVIRDICNGIDIITFSQTDLRA